ncbi:alkaline phosphatase family protein [Aeromicrobium sp. A1-2]|uniref:alkaline phosphatase family protein n=1 Tax=Aeromicrobium sp. A1-2 TaxID=2107713 RepID=UPI000E4B80A2|nr:nucleotide pyrophosphatase/phosphodiesterase family protein [Aeromicrobium sp. A1-2]AXT84808.1 alkaline phosphatase family protein [Aeromicrobium sp. A1-2]
MTLAGLGGRATIDQIMPSVAAALGAPGFANSLGLPEAPRYVVFLVDGLGLDLLREHADAAPFLSSLLNVDDVVCGVPSTTATSLTSLGTGVQAGSHGIVGYTSRVPGSGQRLNSLKWDQPIDPVIWQPHPTVLEQLQAAGVAASSVNDAKFVGTGLTLCSQRGVPFHGINSVWERLDVVLDVIESAPRSVTYAYESRLDHTGHGKGCTSPEWREMLTTIDAELADLREELPRDAVLLVTADHGMIDLPMADRFDVDSLPQLLDDVTLLAGEARFRHLYTRAGASADVAARWQAELGERAIVRTQDGLEDWFGPIAPDVRGRIGDVVVASLGDFAVFSSREFGIELKMTGFHGSVTEAELRIPVLVAP